MSPVYTKRLSEGLNYSTNVRYVFLTQARTTHPILHGRRYTLGTFGATPLHPLMFMTAFWSKPAPCNGARVCTCVPRECYYIHQLVGSHNRSLESNETLWRTAPLFAKLCSEKFEDDTEIENLDHNCYSIRPASTAASTASLLQ